MHIKLVPSPSHGLPVAMHALLIAVALLLLVDTCRGDRVFPCKSHFFYRALQSGDYATFNCTEPTTLIATEYLYLQLTSDTTIDGEDLVTIDFLESSTNYVQIPPGPYTLTFTRMIIKNACQSIDSDGNLVFSYVTVTGTSTACGSSAILSREGTVSVSYSSIYNVQCAGGAFYFQDTSPAIVTRTTCINSAYCFYCNGAYSVTIDYSTLLGDSSIVASTASISIRGSIVQKIYGLSTITSRGYNVFDSNSGITSSSTDVYTGSSVGFFLGPVTEVGETRYYQALLPGSPAINMVSDSNPAVDFLDDNGNVNGAPDAGAVESNLYQGVYFSAAIYQATEGGGTVTITVVKPFASIPQVTVNWQTSTGTAVAGSDYTNSSGAVTWTSGNVLPKTFTVPIGDPDTLQKPSRTFGVSLTSSSTYPATLLNSSATVNITDNDPACYPHSSAGGTSCHCDAGYADPSGAGSSCTQCATGYFNYPNCQYCQNSYCNGHGSCGSNGLCACIGGFSQSTNCSACVANYYGATCSYCTDSLCHGHGSCDTSTSLCKCTGGFSAASNCSSCASNYYGPTCSYCVDSLCHGHGSCNTSNGLCECAGGFSVASNCSTCVNNYYGPSCTYCVDSMCHGHGSCDTSTGLCSCATGYSLATNCSTCSSNYYGPSCSYCVDSLCNGHGHCNGTGVCSCDAGYNPSTNCTDFNECTNSATNNCSANATCTNTPGSFSCACKTGYSGNGYTCTDINECANATLNTCSTNATCSNTPGNFSCTCKTGFYGDGHACSDVDYCSNSTLNTCSINGTCNNIPGGYSCSCKPGYSGDGHTCADINECTNVTLNTCSTNGSCTNTAGNFMCACKLGYYGDGYICKVTDIDECANATLNTCSTNGTCTNTPGSFSCACKSGYLGDGHTCADINECTNATLSTCSKNATCTNTPGSFSCVCNSGHYGDGHTCTEVDPCSNSMLNNCSTNGACTNYPGGYSCACNIGYVRDGLTCTPALVKDTSSSSNNHTGAIVGGVIGGIVGLALLAGLVFFIAKKNKPKPQPVPSFDTTITGGQQGKKFGIAELGTGYSQRNLRENASMADNNL